MQVDDGLTGAAAAPSPSGKSHSRHAVMNRIYATLMAQPKVNDKRVPQFEISSLARYPWLFFYEFSGCFSSFWRNRISRRGRISLSLFFRFVLFASAKIAGASTVRAGSAEALAVKVTQGHLRRLLAVGWRGRLGRPGRANDPSMAARAA
jgi:hypothetical protein